MSSLTAAELALASENCAKEPIHVPGSIQPHGFMLVCDQETREILQVSQNATEWLGIDNGALLGRTLDELIDNAPVAVARMDELVGQENNPFHVADVLFNTGSNTPQTLAMLAHRHDGLLITEFERPVDVESAYSTLYPLIRTYLDDLQVAEDAEHLCRLSVDEVKRISGFGRIKAYRFDAEGNGTVIAECADDDYPRYLGLCFPVSDIPQQARRLYCANRIRVIEDAYYQPSPIVPEINPRTGRPLDMSFAALRSVSPVHLQYMRNMQTRASMSISIVVRGQLWGLISCHDLERRSVGSQTRTACELLGRVLSLQIEAKEANSKTQRLLELRRDIVRMLSAMADVDGVSEGLLSCPQTFVNFVKGTGAAIVTSSRCELVGQTPPAAQVNALVKWLSKRDSSDDVFHSDNIARDIPEVTELSRHAAGVLAVAISEIHSHYLIWFRPEQVRTVNWAGKPEKIVSETGKLHPRHSFDLWQEIVTDYSLPWDPLEIEGAWELRTATLGIVLRKAEELAQLAGELKKSNKELEAFSYSVSHDLRAPLRHIAGYAELLGDFEGSKLSERGMRFLDHIGDSARFAGTLVDNLLSFSQMGRSALRHSDVDLQALVTSIQAEMQPDYEGRRIEWKLDALPVVIADAAFLHLVLRNLLSNAIKYTRGQDPAVIEVGVRENADEVVVFVRDNGVGFDMAYANKLFGVFQRLHRMEEFEGTGIGLASVRRIIERHDGRVWAEGALGEGATFYFSLPKRGYSANNSADIDENADAQTDSPDRG
ncbi:ATP-binding protein [Pseudomonas matsuisoli]|uniref:histidine kinase n=1 Tax=Pseudomonas matsuisoli TaxID=1515666 RepID=A0A917PSX5_9PSED|nr:ATP-binding protein [Pseudomonas matsuisoli]GGJ89947.1 histidine kinase [Pseudomonas matsuisoli]